MMGYDDEHASRRLILDIETAPIDNVAAFIEPADAPSNYRDPLKIEEYVRTKEREQIERAALDVDLCRVIALGVMVSPDSVPLVRLAHDETDERNMLQMFFNLSDEAFFLGFNILDFDLPVLLRRALYLQVNAPRIALDKYRHPRVIDLMQELSWNGKIRYRSLAFYCRRFGISATDDDVESRRVPELFAAEQFDAVKEHVRCDVLQVAGLAARLGHWTNADVVQRA
jgi:hypothetical protein